ncbi:hypothetical protein [Sphingobacterium sp. LRF_L2]|uniref:hypothetical protein n=1 Tax=Sphingobacterium sp. LRF_L2 TaxID=3369421 RepID=UPI003F5E9A3F
MNTAAKKAYSRPTIEVAIVELEQSIAAASATVSGGQNAGSAYTPGLDDWATDETLGSTIGEY